MFGGVTRGTETETLEPEPAPAVGAVLVGSPEVQQPERRATGVDRRSHVVCLNDVTAQGLRPIGVRGRDAPGNGGVLR
jgi:hypothetical protein